MNELLFTHDMLSRGIDPLSFPSISCSTALKKMAEGIGKAVSARFRALRDLFFSQKSEDTNPWPKALANGEKWVDEILTKETVSKASIPILSPLSKEKGQGSRYIARDDARNIGQPVLPVINPELPTPITNGESGTAASGALDLTKKKPVEGGDDDGVVYRPTESSSLVITAPGASVVLSPKETKSSTPTPKSGMAVDRVTNPKETLEYLQKVRSEAYANRVKCLMGKNAEREHVQKTLDAPLTKREGRYLQTLPGKRTENEIIIRQARFPETKQLWESRISSSQWVPDLQDWCIDNNVNIHELDKWKRCFPPS